MNARGAVWTVPGRGLPTADDDVLPLSALQLSLQFSNLVITLRDAPLQGLLLIQGLWAGDTSTSM